MLRICHITLSAEHRVLYDHIPPIANMSMACQRFLVKQSTAGCSLLRLYVLVVVSVQEKQLQRRHICIGSRGHSLLPMHLCVHCSCYPCARHSGFKVLIWGIVLVSAKVFFKRALFWSQLKTTQNLF